MKEWEEDVDSQENFQRIQLMMQGADPYMYSGDGEAAGYPPFEGEGRLDNGVIPVEGLDDVGREGLENEEGKGQNLDIQVDQRSSSQVYNLPVIQMGEMLQNQQQPSLDSRGAISSYYSNLSVMGASKPFFFPPPDLGVVESMGSYENSSRFFRSVKSSNMNKSFHKNTSICGLKNRKNTTHEEMEQESPLKTQIFNKEEEKALENSAKKAVEKLDELNDNISETSLKSIDSNFSSNHRVPTNNSEKVEEEKPEKQDMACGPMETLDSLASDENPLNLSTESYYVLEDLTREGLQKYLKDSMLIFNEKYSISKKELEDDIEVPDPTFDLCYKY